MFGISETQLGMFLEWSANRSSLQYNITGSCRLPKSIDLTRLESAVRETVEAYPVFRTRFVETPSAVFLVFDISHIVFDGSSWNVPAPAGYVAAVCC